MHDRNLMEALSKSERESKWALFCFPLLSFDKNYSILDLQKDF